MFVTLHRRDSTETRVNAAAAALRDRDQARVASVVELARDLGLRFREASLLDVREALAQARELGRINITAGTKGGRGREVDRWVPVSESALQTLESAAALQQDSRNLIPPTMSYRQWRDHAYAVWRTTTNQYDLSGFHDLRAAYACDRYAATDRLSGTRRRGLPPGQQSSRSFRTALLEPPMIALMEPLFHAVLRLRTG